MDELSEGDGPDDGGGYDDLLDLRQTEQELRVQERAYQPNEVGPVADAAAFSRLTPMPGMTPDELFTLGTPNVPPPTEPPAADRRRDVALPNLRRAIKSADEVAEALEEEEEDQRTGPNPTVALLVAAGALAVFAVAAAGSRCSP
ncbi:MAG: hypothetical protein R3F59_21430 [Myxococcota bacterium]